MNMNIDKEKNYLYLKASKVSILLARRAGTTPVKNPTVVEKITTDITNQTGLKNKSTF